MCNIDQNKMFDIPLINNYAYLNMETFLQNELALCGGIKLFQNLHPFVVASEKLYLLCVYKFYDLKNKSSNTA